MKRTILAILGLTTFANGVNLTNSLGAQAADADCGCCGCGGNSVDIDIQFMVNSGGAVGTVGARDTEEDDQTATGDESLAPTAVEGLLAGVSAGTDPTESSTMTTTTTTTTSTSEEDLAGTTASENLAGTTAQEDLAGTSAE